MGDLTESAKLRNAMKKLVKQVIDEEEKACFRLYKAQVKGAPNGTTCTVQLDGYDNTMDLPYSTAINNLSVNDMVWVATLYNSFSNAIVFAPIGFDLNDKDFFYQELSQAISPTDAWKIDLRRNKILLISVHGYAPYVDNTFVHICFYSNQWGSGNDVELFKYDFGQAGNVTFSIVRDTTQTDYYLIIGFQQNSGYTTTSIQIDAKIYVLS